MIRYLILIILLLSLSVEAQFGGKSKRYIDRIAQETAENTAARLISDSLANVPTVDSLVNVTAGLLDDSLDNYVKVGTATTGFALRFECPNQATMTDGQTLYWGNSNLDRQTSPDLNRIYIPNSGTLTVCYIYGYALTAGSGDNWSVYIRLNNTTDYLVQTLGSTDAQRLWSNTSLSIGVSAGDYFEIKEVCPTWSTNPMNHRRSGVIYVE